MVCRMLVAAGEFQVARLLDDFKLMALNRNEEHELNESNPKFIHDDGWGIVIGKSGKLEWYKKEVACWKDPRFKKYRKADANFLLLHARRASPGSPKGFNYTHPFERENWYFCHNGTIRDFKSNEIGDSEQFFSLVLGNPRRHEDVKEAIENVVNQIEDYTALNFILANNSKAYVLVKYNQNPRYYTMKYLQNENHVIVSSEKLPNFHGEWKRVENGTLIVLDIVNHQVEVRRSV